MNDNAIRMKRAMKYLGLSGVELARMVTALRDDGKVTAPETISRWLNGVNSVDPCLLGWLGEMVRTKMLRSKIGAGNKKTDLKALLVQIVNELNDDVRGLADDKIEEMSTTELLDQVQ